MLLIQLTAILFLSFYNKTSEDSYIQQVSYKMWF